MAVSSTSMEKQAKHQKLLSASSLWICSLWKSFVINMWNVWEKNKLLQDFSQVHMC